MFKLLILDVDGVLCSNKGYNFFHETNFKCFNDKDFTAIKKFKVCNIPVVFISGDIWNTKMAEKRNIPFYCSKKDDGILDKVQFLPILEKEYGVDRKDMAFVFDDYFDLDLAKEIEYPFCPKDANSDVIKFCNKKYEDDFGITKYIENVFYYSMNHLNYNNYYILERNGGEGCIDSLFSLCERNYGLKRPENFEQLMRDIDSKEK